MSAEANTLREALKDWTDMDVAEYFVLVHLDIMDSQRFPSMRSAKHVFWSNNPIGNMATRFLEEMVAVGILEKRDEPDFQYRWNAAFKGSWER